ncbi:hypothetical protein, partial [Bacillus altitudinis]|uniref:hypothetical protein n=1 Tax=Bacillus altitudinis TaxID=293387 RepID=UPI002F95A59B
SMPERAFTLSCSPAIRRLALSCALLLSVGMGGVSSVQAEGTPGGAPYGFGTVASPAAIAAWDIDIDAKGNGLPRGQGSVAEGARLYAEKCA